MVGWWWWWWVTRIWLNDRTMILLRQQRLGRWPRRPFQERGREPVYWREAYQRGLSCRNVSVLIASTWLPMKHFTNSRAGVSGIVPLNTSAVFCTLLWYSLIVWLREVVVSLTQPRTNDGVYSSERMSCGKIRCSLARSGTTASGPQSAFRRQCRLVLI